MQRKTQREHADGAELLGGPAGDPRPGTAPTGDDGQPRLLQRGPDPAPPDVERLGRGRELLPRHPPRLLDERDRDPLLGQDTGNPLQIPRLDATPGPVTERQHKPRPLGRVPGDAGVPGGCLNDLDPTHKPHPAAAGARGLCGGGTGTAAAPSNGSSSSLRGSEGGVVARRTPGGHGQERALGGHRPAAVRARCCRDRELCGVRARGRGRRPAAGRAARRRRSLGTRPQDKPAARPRGVQLPLAEVRGPGPRRPAPRRPAPRRPAPRGSGGLPPVSGRGGAGEYHPPVRTACPLPAPTAPPAAPARCSGHC